MKFAGPLQIAGSMVIWSSWGLFIRWLPVAPWTVTYYVGVISCVVTAILWRVRGNPWRELWPRSQGVLLPLMGALFLANSLLYLTAYERTTVANAVLTHYTAPIFVAALAPVTLGERLLPATLPAIVLSAAGTGLLLPWAELYTGSRHLQGMLMGTGSGVAYAGLILLARHLSPRVSPAQLIFYQNLTAVLLLAPWAIQLSLPRDASTWLGLVVLGSVHATGAAFLYLAGIREVKAQVAGVLGYLEPLGVVALGAVALGERPGAACLLGGALILAGGAAVLFDEGRGRGKND